MVPPATPPFVSEAFPAIHRQGRPHASAPGALRDPRRYRLRRELAWPPRDPRRFGRAAVRIDGPIVEPTRSPAHGLRFFAHSFGAAFLFVTIFLF